MILAESYRSRAKMVAVFCSSYQNISFLCGKKEGMLILCNGEEGRFPLDSQNERFFASWLGVRNDLLHVLALPCAEKMNLPRLERWIIVEKAED